MKPAALLFTALLAGCSSQYRVELWNDTGQEINVSMIERYRGIPANNNRPRATIAPAGWFQYKLDKGRSGFSRAVYVRAAACSREIDLTGAQIYRARIAIVDGELRPEELSATDAALRMKER